MPEHPTLSGMAAAGFRSAAYFYWAGRELAAELRAGAVDAIGRATGMARCKVTEEQLDYICGSEPRRADV